MKQDTKNPEYTIIGKKIKEARDEAGLSQFELAQKIGKKSSTYVALIESGDRKVSIVDIKKISEFLNKPVEYFIEEKDQPNEVIEYALRAVKKLDGNKQKQIVDFIDFIKKRNDQ